jgi:beta-carotene 15,15'-dioxygenase
MATYNPARARHRSWTRSFVCLRLWLLPLATLILVLTDNYWVAVDGVLATAIAAALILFAGIPHGTLDVEIAALRFDRQDFRGKSKIIIAYIICAALMALLWYVLPALALILFLILSIIHFGADWHRDDDRFFSVMVGWALIAMPALSHPDAVASIFEMLTADQSGATIAAILACTAVPAIVGSLIFAVREIKQNARLNGIDVIACLAAAALLPPLVGFAVFFCGLHSPRHLAEAIRQSGQISLKTKGLIGGAVTALSLGLAALLFAGQGPVELESSLIRTAFILLSILTVPHFILEQLYEIGDTDHA